MGTPVRHQGAPFVKKIQQASIEELANEDLMKEASEVLTAIREAAQRSSAFSRMLPYNITKRANKGSAAVEKMGSTNPTDHEVIISFVRDTATDRIRFWNLGIPAMYTDAQSRDLAARGYTCIAFCFALEGTELHHRLLQRFARLVVYKLTQSGRTALSISEDMEQAGLGRGKSSKELFKDISGFIKAGRRYQKFAGELGGFGALFFLPGVGRTIWEDQLPISGDLYAKAIQTLNDVGIPSMAKLYNKVAEQLIEYGLNVVSRIAHTQSPWINTLLEPTDDHCKRQMLLDASQVQRALQGISPDIHLERPHEERSEKAKSFDHGSIDLTDEDSATNLNTGLSSCGTVEFPNVDATTPIIRDLLPFVDNSTIILLNQRMNSAQLRWSNNGEVVTVSPCQAGFDLQLVATLFTTDQSTCHASNTLPVQHKNMCIEVLNYVCFAFPRIKGREPQFVSLVNSLYPLLNHLLRSFTKEDLSTSLVNEVAEALLAAAKVKRTLLQSVANYLGKSSPLHLHAELALERSISLRLSGHYDESERAIHDFCCLCDQGSDRCLSRFFQRPPLDRTARLNALFGLLHRSHLENLVQCDQYQLATSQMCDWTMPDHPSSLELSILPLRTLTSCKILRSQGNFERAREGLEICLKGQRDASYHQLLCQLLDVYADLGLSQKSLDLIDQEIVRLSGECQDSKAQRRILVASLDVHLQHQCYSRAEQTVQVLSKRFMTLHHLDISDELLHMRVLISGARISHMKFEYVEAAQKWKFALEHVQRYASFRGAGFTYAVIHLSLAHAYIGLRHVDEAMESFHKGQAIVREGKRDFWIPTLSEWSRHIASCIQSEMNWECFV